MPRTTAALFTPLFESILLSLICYTAFHAFFSSTVSSDYTASIRSALFCSLSVNVATCFMQLVVSAAGKAETISFDANNKISYKHALAIANVHCCAIVVDSDVESAFAAAAGGAPVVLAWSQLDGSTFVPV